MIVLLKMTRTDFGAGFVAALLAMAVSAGCNRAPARSPSKEVPITGRVTLDGNPLAEAEVQFTTANFASFAGATDNDGVFKLWSSVGGEQTCEGPCQVTISKYVLPEGATPEPDVSPMMQGGQQLLPPRYWDPGFTELTADVPKDGGSFDFALQSR